MGLLRPALLLLLSYLTVHMTGGAVYQCNDEKTSDQEVNGESSAQLTKGCVLKKYDITFNLYNMLWDPKGPVVINISEAVFINSTIMLMYSYALPDNKLNAFPLLLTISDSEMTGSSKLEFGKKDNRGFKLPTNSHIRILNSKMHITTKDTFSSIIIFNFIQLVTSSIEIAHNVITMEYKSGVNMAVFDVRDKMTISDNSDFILRDNEISMNARGKDINIMNQYVWYHYGSDLTIRTNSNYKWASNNIIMVINGGKESEISQYLWYTKYSTQTISSNSQLLLDANRILMLAWGYANSIVSSVMMIIGDSNGKGTISNNSSMVWKDNCVAMGHKNTDKRNVFLGKWSITDKSELLWTGNYFTITDKYEQGSYDSGLTGFLWGPKGDTGFAIITDADSKLSVAKTQIHGNSAAGSMVWNSSLWIYKTDVDTPMVWGSYPAQDGKGTPIPTLNTDNLQQYMCVGLPNIPTPTPTYTPTPISTKGDSETDILPTIPLGPKNPVVKKPTVVRKPTTTPPTEKPNPQPTEKPTNPDNNNQPTKRNKTITNTTGKSATAITSTVIPSVLITSVVLLYLYNW